jgi:hypothetical protein
VGMVGEPNAKWAESMYTYFLKRIPTRALPDIRPYIYRRRLLRPRWTASPACRQLELSRRRTIASASASAFSSSFCRRRSSSVIAESSRSACSAFDRAKTAAAAAAPNPGPARLVWLVRLAGLPSAEPGAKIGWPVNRLEVGPPSAVTGLSFASLWPSTPPAVRDIIGAGASDSSPSRFGADSGGTARADAALSVHALLSQGGP